MAAISGKDLLLRVKQRFPEVEFPADAAETLEHVQKFLSDNRVQIQNDATHQVLSNYSDWWDCETGNKSGPKFLAISEDYAVEELHRCIAKMYKLRAPLTLGEKRTNEFTLFQDIVIRGSGAETSIDPEALIGPKSKFLEVIGSTMVELYPNVNRPGAEKSLHCFVLDGSGLNRDHGKRETVVRLVWGGIIVNKNRALGVLDILVSKMQKSESPEVKELARAAKKDSEVNEWKACFQEGTFVKPDPIRMIFNDSVSKPPMMKIEERPFKPAYIYEITHSNGKLEEIKPVADEFKSEEWAKFTAIRQHGSSDLTDWEPPKGHQERASMHGEYNGFHGAAGRNGAKVHMRTIGGSPADRPQRGASGRPQEDKQSNQTRLLPGGTIEVFMEKMQQVFGPEQGDFEEKRDEKKVIWTQKTSKTIVEFREPNQTVYVSGKEGSVRHILSIAGQFLENIPEGYTGAETASRVQTRNSYAGSKAPSKVFEGGSLMARTKPTSVSALSLSNKPKSKSTTNGVKKVPYKRIVVQEFEKEDKEDLALTVGQKVTVEKDPDAEEDILDRWVFGSIDETGESGWFSLGFTRDLVE